MGAHAAARSRGSRNESSAALRTASCAPGTWRATSPHASPSAPGASASARSEGVRDGAPLPAALLCLRIMRRGGGSNVAVWRACLQTQLGSYWISNIPHKSPASGAA